MTRVPLLVATSGPLKGDRFQVTEDGLMVGRDPECAVTIPDQGISRQHARVLLHNSAVWVQDTGSRNGVFVNGKRVTRPKQLGPGDEMTLGKHQFTVELADDDAMLEQSVSVIISRRDDERRPIARWVLTAVLVAAIVITAILAVMID